MNEFYPIIVALVFNGLDLATGLVAAVKEKDIKSSKLRDGLFKKVGFIACYFVAWLVDKYGVQIGFQFGMKILPVIILYVCTTELVSVIENICRINPEIGKNKLLEIFRVSEKGG